MNPYVIFLIFCVTVVGGFLKFADLGKGKDALIQLEEEMSHASAPPAPSAPQKTEIREAVKIERVDDKTVSVPDFKGRPLLVNFWASWCGPCMQEMPGLYKLKDKYADRGLEILSINMDLDLGRAVGSLEKKFGIPKFPIVHGHGESYSDAFDMDGVPYTVLIDREGKIRYSEAGERDWLDAESSALVEGIL